MIVLRFSLALALVLGVLGAQAQQPAPAPAAPEDERGFIRDDINLSFSFTRGSNKYYDYDDFRIYLAARAHYAFSGPDYLDTSLLINRFDRSYSDPRYDQGPLTNLFDMDLTYVFGGGQRDAPGLYHAAGASLFSRDLFDDVNLSLGYGGVYNYKGGGVRLLAGMGRNLGYADRWSPLLELSWMHNLPLGTKWRLQTRIDLMWNSGRGSRSPTELNYPDTIYVLDGALYYQLVKDWSLYARYFNDNASDNPSSYLSLGVSHRFRRPPPRR